MKVILEHGIIGKHGYELLPRICLVFNQWYDDNNQNCILIDISFIKVYLFIWILK